MRIFGAKSDSTSAGESTEGGRAYFLLTFNTKTGVLVSEQRIDDATEAMAAFAAAEREHALLEADIRVVMFSADSIETVRGTHPHYFAGPGTGADPFGSHPLVPAH